jgi:hypothetical protein
MRIRDPYKSYNGGVPLYITYLHQVVLIASVAYLHQGVLIAFIASLHLVILIPSSYNHQVVLMASITYLHQVVLIAKLPITVGPVAVGLDEVGFLLAVPVIHVLFQLK